MRDRISGMALALVIWLGAPAVAAAAPPRASGGAATAAADSAAEEIAMMDSSGDGKLTREEHAAGVRKMFLAMDADKDGKVTAAEMKAAEERVMGAERRAAATDLSPAERIKIVDRDGDGTLTADEHAAGARMIFGKMDTDKDGLLTRAELAAGHAKLLKRQPQKP